MSYTDGRRRAVGLVALALSVALAVGVLGVSDVRASTDGPLHVFGGSGPQAQVEADSDPDANLGFLFAVYIVTWAGFFGYVFIMSRRQREMRREIDTLKAVLDERREAGESG